MHPGMRQMLVVDCKIHQINLMFVPESRGVVGRADGINGRDNRIPDNVRRQIVELALDEPELSPRELAVTFIYSPRV